MTPRDVGLYSRANSDKEYISPDLNLHKLYKVFKEMHPNSPVLYTFYIAMFRKDFPHVSFRRPRVATCSLCDQLSYEVRANLPSSHDAKISLDLHH